MTSRFKRTSQPAALTSVHNNTLSSRSTSFVPPTQVPPVDAAKTLDPSQTWKAWGLQDLPHIHNPNTHQNTALSSEQSAGSSEDSKQSSSESISTADPKNTNKSHTNLGGDLFASTAWRAHPCPKCVPASSASPNANAEIAEMNDINGAFAGKGLNSLCVHSTGVFFCAVCGYHGNALMMPSRYRDTWMSAWRLFLQDPSWSHTPPEHIQKMHVVMEGCWAPAWLDNQWILAWHAWCRMPAKHTSHESNHEPHADPIDAAWVWNSENAQWSRPRLTNVVPYGWDQVVIMESEGKEQGRVVFVCHMEDWLVLRHANVPNVVCLPPDLSAALPTAPAWRVLEVMEDKMKNLGEIVLATRATSTDRALEDELGRRMDRERCYRTRWRPDGVEDLAEEKGPQEALTAYGVDSVQLMVEAAPPFPVIGVYELQDVEDRFDSLYDTGLTPGAATGWPTLDQHYTIKTGQWTAVTGIPGHGKSSWLDGLLVNLATMHGWRFGMFSPENQPIERHFASLMEKKLKKPFSDGPTPRITVTERNATKKWLNDRFKVILPDEENGVWTLDAVLGLAKKLVYRYGIRGLVIDPWNELDHTRSSNVNETSHISESLTKIRRFARLYDVHVWIVAHPTKLEKKADGKYPVATPYDISGGAHWRNKADNALSIYRNVDEEDSDVCDIYVQKIRFREIGRLGRISLRCDTISGAYVDDIDQKKREHFLGSGSYAPSSSQRILSPRQYPENHAALEYDHGHVF